MNDTRFWWFTHERQRIWRRRTVHGATPPWTDDSVLRDRRFCNIHRELDRGTVVLRRQLSAHATAPPELMVLNTLLYRLFNRPDVPWTASQDAAVAFSRERVARLGRGAPVFSRAWNCAQVSKGGPDGVGALVASWTPGHLAELTARAGSLREVLPEVTRLAGFGAVSGWQVTLDLTYTFTHLSDDEWIPRVRTLKTWRRPAGGGACRVTSTHGPAQAARLIDPEASFVDLVTRLRDEQTERLARLGLDWAQVAWTEKPRLTLADIENALCEYWKWETERGSGRFHGGPWVSP